MNKFQQLPIKWQLVITNMSIAVGTLLLSFLVLYSYNRNALQERMVRELNLLIEPIGLNNTASIRFHSNQDAIASLRVLRANPYIEVATLLYPDSTVFVEYFKNDQPIAYQLPEERVNGYTFNGTALEVFRAIEVDEILFGYIYIRSNLEELRELRNENFQIALLAILASSVFAFVSVLLLMKPISNPIKRLAHQAVEIGEHHNYATRVDELPGNNETAQLYRAFNIMLQQIEEQDLALKDAFDFLNSQKEEIRQKNIDIMDSINSAQRLQHIILPQLRSIKRVVPDAFVYFRPKDVLSGDFYWFAHKGKWNYFAAVDCVGHGVPGALLSIIADTWLQRIVVERGYEDPGQVLTRLDAAVTRNLRSETGSARSMDIALVAVNFHTLELRFAGAYSPLYIVRADELIELKADRLAIGTLRDHHQRAFTTHRFKLQKDDMIYLFSDGFADQFGGVENKKFKYQAFRELLRGISTLPVHQQEEKLEEAFQRWRGLNEQVDDITVMGIRTPARVTEMLPFYHR